MVPPTLTGKVPLKVQPSLICGTVTVMCHDHDKIRHWQSDGITPQVFRDLTAH